VPIQGLVQATDQVRVSRIGETRGLAAKDSFRESVVEEGILHIELLNGSVTGDSSVRTVAGFTTGLKVSS
jgi:hypothetical protein